MKIDYLFETKTNHLVQEGHKKTRSIYYEFYVGPEGLEPSTFRL